MLESCRELLARDASCDTAAWGGVAEQLQQAVASELDEGSQGFIAVEPIVNIGDSADPAAVAHEVLKKGGHQLLVLFEDLGEERGRVEHRELAGVHDGLL